MDQGLGDAFCRRRGQVLLSGKTRPQTEPGSWLNGARGSTHPRRTGGARSTQDPSCRLPPIFGDHMV